MSKLFSKPKKLVVKAGEDGAPLVMARDGRVEKVVKVHRRWRICDQWWKEEIAREYFLIETSSGVICEIYRDMTSGIWYLSRLYD